VLRLRFGLEDGRAHTLEEVGAEFDVTRERIRQIEVQSPAQAASSVAQQNSAGLSSTERQNLFPDEFFPEKKNPYHNPCRILLKRFASAVG
jgi:hypothetical protein